jgi:hypothetical protein
VTPSGPTQIASASGIWTLDQQLQYQQQGIWPTAGVAPVYIEDVFSTYLYAGNGGTQTITNSIDLSTKGGLVWIKNRTLAAGHAWTDTARGAGTGTAKASTNILQSDSNGGTGGGLPASSNDYLSAFTTTGFTVVSSNGANDGTKVTNRSSSNYVSWSFRKQAKFFDIVTYTGTGANRTISHNLGSVPGCIMVKRTDGAGDWQVYHRSLANTDYIVLNSTAAQATGATRWNSTTPTSTVFSLGTDATVNANGGTYVAYLFAHNAGGFGNNGTDNVISCGSFTADSGGNASVTLGYEPQMVIIKSFSSSSNWWMFDSMRGQPVGANGQALYSNLSDAESASSYIASPTATGLNLTGWIPDVSYIYIAIRRGPMKTPTSGTSVFQPALQTASSTAQTKVYGIVTDAVISKARNSSNVYTGEWWDRLRGAATANTINNADTEKTIYTTSLIGFDVQNGVRIGTDTSERIQATCNWVHYAFSRAPGFFDEVCYTGTGSATTFTHNLGVVPQLMIVKGRSDATAWQVYSSALANTEYLVLNTTAAKATGATRWNSTTPTSTVFSLGTATEVNTAAATYVAYLFATVSGVSKVGSYTGTGALQTVNCGFTSGARFVLIKRTDTTGDWWVYDSARGISSGDDPYVFFNSTAAEVTNTNYVDTDTTGFKVTAAAPAGLNANGGNYIFLAIA